MAKRRRNDDDGQLPSTSRQRLEPVEPVEPVEPDEPIITRLEVYAEIQSFIFEHLNARDLFTLADMSPLMVNQPALIFRDKYYNFRFYVHLHLSGDADVEYIRQGYTHRIQIYGLQKCRRFIEFFHRGIYNLLIYYQGIDVTTCLNFNRFVAQRCAETLVRLDLNGLRGPYRRQSIFDTNMPFERLEDLRVGSNLREQLPLLSVCFPNVNTIYFRTIEAQNYNVRFQRLENLNITEGVRGNRNFLRRYQPFFDTNRGLRRLRIFTEFIVNMDTLRESLVHNNELSFLQVNSQHRPNYIMFDDLFRGLRQQHPLLTGLVMPDQKFPISDIMQILQNGGILRLFSCYADQTTKLQIRRLVRIPEFVAGFRWRDRSNMVVSYIQMEKLN